MTSHAATAVQPRGTAARIAYATLGAVLLVAIVLETVTHGTGYWQIAVFGLGSDAALFFGAGSGLAKGQLHPRAVGLYNLLHRFWGPLLLAAFASFGLIPVGYLVGALAWAFHIALDRALGYGLRTRDGFQRA
ncbi:MAG: DUF4260 family protein [Gaiellaceae bacterium]